MSAAFEDRVRCGGSMFVNVCLFEPEGALTVDVVERLVTLVGLVAHAV